MSIDHYENFPVASWLCPPALRPAVRALYGFARTADDIADEGDAPAQARLADLAAYRQALERALAGQAVESRWAPVLEPLRQAVREHRLPVEPLRALLSAFEQDVHNPTYPDRAALLDYCRRSANPVGRLLLHLYGIGDRQAQAQSDAVCTALQLVNFWQDLSVDIPRGRHYVPLDAAVRHGVTLDMLARRQDTAATRALVQELCAWADALMRDGEPLVHRIPGRAGWELRLVVQGARRILEKIGRMNHATLRRRPVLHPSDGPLLAWRALRMRPAAPVLEGVA